MEKPKSKDKCSFAITGTFRECFLKKFKSGNFGICCSGNYCPIWER